jgi:hypothetical protein
METSWNFPIFPRRKYTPPLLSTSYTVRRNGKFQKYSLKSNSLITKPMFIELHTTVPASTKISVHIKVVRFSFFSSSVRPLLWENARVKWPYNSNRGWELPTCCLAHCNIKLYIFWFLFLFYSCEFSSQGMQYLNGGHFHTSSVSCSDF